MTQDGHLTGGTSIPANHPGNPREFFGPIKKDVDQLFIHTTEDLANLDHFLEFQIGNGQMICRLDALCSQHLQGRKKRGVMAVHHSEAWGAQAFPYYRCRPVGKLINNLFVGREGKPLQIGDISEYAQRVDIQSGVLETSFRWQAEGCKGHTAIRVFMSQADPDVMVFRFLDHVEQGKARRVCAVETLVPYPYRLIDRLAEAEEKAEPDDNTRYGHDDHGCQWIDYEFHSSQMKTKMIWCGCSLPAQQQISPVAMEPRNRGGMAFLWDCRANQTAEVDIAYAVVSDRNVEDPHQAALHVLEKIKKEGVGHYEERHTSRWRQAWGESNLQLSDKFWQKQGEIARYSLLINTGGRWVGNIAAEEFAWDAHMLDSIMALNALVEWGHLDYAQKGFEALDRLYEGAANNGQLVSKYFGTETVGEAALLPTFLTYDGNVAIYAVNHFLLHSEQNSGHALGMLRLAEYLGDREMMQDMVYRWLRAYANYALLISEWNEQQQGYVFPLWKAGTLMEDQWWHLQVAGMPLKKRDSIADLFPESLREKNLYNSVDTALSHQWILNEAARLAEQLGRDEDLSKRWLNVASRIIVPRNDKMILRSEIDDGKAGGHIPSDLWGLFYPCQGNDKLFPPDVIRATLDNSFKRRNPHIPSWNGLFYAIAYASLGDGEQAFRLIEELLKAQDPRCIQTQDNVGVEGFVYYYALNHAFLLLALRNMLLNDQDEQVTLFPAIPQAWGSVAFEQLPLRGGWRVSARLDGDTGEASFQTPDGQQRLKIIGRIRNHTVPKSLLANPAGQAIEV